MQRSNIVFSSLRKNQAYATGEAATKAGISTKTFILLAITLVSGFLSIYIPVGMLTPVMIGAIVVGFISMIVSVFKPKLSMFAGITYSIGQGLLYGTVTYLLSTVYEGIGTLAMIGTGAIFIVMLVLYNTGLLRGSSLLRKVVIGVLIASLFGSLVISILSLTAPAFVNALAGNFQLAVLFTIISIVLGAFMLTLDFDDADRVVAMGVGKEYEWSVALGFMVTLVYIYVNILKLILLTTRNK